jgi:hypothetical protein
MKKSSKRLSLSTQTIRPLQTEDLAQIHGGTGTITTGTTIIQPGTGTSIHTGTTVLSPSGGTSIIRTR